VIAPDQLEAFLMNAAPVAKRGRSAPAAERQAAAEALTLLDLIEDEGMRRFVALPVIPMGVIDKA
jgi:hypothetical protein